MIRGMYVMKDDKLLKKMAIYDIKNNLSTLDREELWDMALGLQNVDGYGTPSMLLEILSNYNIEDQVTIEEITNYLKEYYRYAEIKLKKQKERDLVSTRIVSFLKQDIPFSMNAQYLKKIHHYLFQDVYEFAGSYRKTSLKSEEEILMGDSIYFTPFYEIDLTLQYEFQLENDFSYDQITNEQLVKHLARFVSSIWQVHPFREGNTRTVAIFLQKYLYSLGYPVNNDLFKENSLYFRNALVRSQYQNQQLGIDYSYDGLEKFFENLLFDTQHDLSNDFLKVSMDTNKVLKK